MTTYSLSIHADVTQLAAARQFVADVGERLGLPESVTDPLTLAMDESLSNIILHGYKDKPGLIGIDLELLRDAVVIRLRDQAAPFDPTRLPNPDTTLPLDKRPVGGMGVYLARRSVDSIAYERTEDGGNLLTLTKKIAAG